jgi:hypothetical protein
VVSTETKRILVSQETTVNVWRPGQRLLVAGRCPIGFPRSDHQIEVAVMTRSRRSWVTAIGMTFAESALPASTLPGVCMLHARQYREQGNGADVGQAIRHIRRIS